MVRSSFMAYMLTRCRSFSCLRVPTFSRVKHTLMWVDAHCQGVCRESRQTEVDTRRHGKDLRVSMVRCERRQDVSAHLVKVGGHRERLVAQPSIASNGDAFLSDHCDHAPSISVHAGQSSCARRKIDRGLAHSSLCVAELAPCFKEAERRT